MTATVEQTQADLQRLIRLAIEGEEVVITMSGQPVAKLTAIAPTAEQADRLKWLDELRQLREATATGSIGKTIEQILEADREDRL